MRSGFSGSCLSAFAPALPDMQYGVRTVLRKRKGKKICMPDGGKPLVAVMSQDLSRPRPVEASEHLKRLRELFFRLPPDRDAVESDIRRALFSVDQPAVNMQAR
jgi:hypothetical protein